MLTRGLIPETTISAGPVSIHTDCVIITKWSVNWLETGISYTHLANSAFEYMSACCRLRPALKQGKVAAAFSHNPPQIKTGERPPVVMCTCNVLQRSEGRGTVGMSWSTLECTMCFRPVWTVLKRGEGRRVERLER